MLVEYWMWILHNREELRDIGSIALGFLAIVLLTWRSMSAGRQATASQAQAKVAQEQIALARQDSLVDRYQRGSDMLGSNNMSSRIGGIYSLKRLAEDHPETYHIQIMELLSAFVRSPTAMEHPSGPIREDVQAALSAIVHRSDEGIEIEDAADFSINLQNAHLTGADLNSAKLRKAFMPQANLENTCGIGAEFSGAELNSSKIRSAFFCRAHFDYAKLLGANMSRSNFKDASFEGSALSGELSKSIFNGACLRKARIDAANLTDTNLEGADLSDAKFNKVEIDRRALTDDPPQLVPEFCRVTQAQLDLAIADPSNPPIIHPGTLDPETGKPIVWNHFTKRPEGASDAWQPWKPPSGQG